MLNLRRALGLEGLGSRSGTNLALSSGFCFQVWLVLYCPPHTLCSTVRVGGLAHFSLAEPQLKLFCCVGDSVLLLRAVQRDPRSSGV